MRLSPLTVLSVFVLASAEPSVAQAVRSIEVSPLPVEQVLPLEAEQCGCMLFRRGAQQSPDRVLQSSTPTVARLQVSGKDYELQHVSRRNSQGRYTSTYAGHGLIASVTAKQVPFRQACSAYPDPPLHGSCFLGTLSVKSQGGAQSIQVTGLCGC